MRNGLSYKMRGAFSEFNDNEGRRFIEIYVLEYNPENKAQLERMGVFEDSQLHKYLSLQKEPVNDDTRFLYKLMTYHGNPEIRDPWKFSEHVTNYEQLGFSSIEKLLEYCENRWGINAEDFKPQSETNIP